MKSTTNTPKAGKKPGFRTSAKPPNTPGPWVWDGYSLRPAEPDPKRWAVHTILDAESLGHGFLGSDTMATQAELAADHQLIVMAPELLDGLVKAHVAMWHALGNHAKRSQLGIELHSDTAMFSDVGQAFMAVSELLRRAGIRGDGMTAATRIQAPGRHRTGAALPARRPAPPMRQPINRPSRLPIRSAGVDRRCPP